jgi:hypothetical protein
MYTQDSPPWTRVYPKAQYSARLSSDPNDSKLHGATRQQAIAKTPVKWSAYQILSVILVFVILIFKA